MRPLVLALLLCACKAQPEPRADECPCKESANAREGGAVVVRWRVLDAEVGRLFSRGQCCCAPAELPAGSVAASECDDSGSRCPATPAWLIDEVRLLVRPLSPGAGVGGREGPCYISAPCRDAELTTPFCLSAGEYDLQLVASLRRLHPTEARFTPMDDRVRTPGAFRRQVRPGQIVNLDAVILGVNEPPQVQDTGANGGAPDSR